MRWSLPIICVVICIFGYVKCDNPATKPVWNATWTDKLKKDLLVAYDKYARPANHFNTTRVNLTLTITHVDIDEKRSMFSTNAWLKMRWTDEKLQWNPADYGNMTLLHVGNHEVWQPDVVLYNSASDIDHYGSTQVLVYQTGMVIWVPPSHFETFCVLDLTYWPYDQQQCSLVLGSWVFDGLKLDLWPEENAVDIELLIKSNEWQIINTTSARNVKMYECCTEPYVSVEFNVTMARRPNVFRAVVTVPALTVALMTLATFCLPIGSGQKILLCGVNTITVVLLLMYFTSRLGNMAITTPLIVVFYSNTLYLVGLSMLISIAVINIANRKNSRRPLPWYIKKALDGRLGKYLWIERNGNQICQFSSLDFMKRQQKMNLPRDQELRDQPFDEHGASDNDHIIQLSTTNASMQEDWLNFAKAIDRISLICYCAIFAISGLSYCI